MRTVDLARRAGISTQQVRNYVDAGFLPPVERTASGYRAFTDRHAEAIIVARRVAAGSPERVRTELAKREQDLHRRSLPRLRGSAALYDYLRN
ncbi:MAG TPA: MerR family DNA-binding transcriptional regulator [Amycolatopsis sp.]|uniref:MerR family DNA-binding transcriptional regulator n=1 Tax=Amycolatopsis sp. TaxID=37632 RepID=UPI002B4716AB|nr:MerR family DNA-binding transcriptional regulator [Amycolatopsis sp.]HKS49906.1 MerR family DNA-binding transcriptional regulator [Amycolatopsis sp.]